LVNTTSQPQPDGVSRILIGGRIDKEAEMAGKTSRKPAAEILRPHGADLRPGDEVPPGTPGSGEDICPTCKGTGRLAMAACSQCGGTGRITRAIGGA
jgi:hypothetical protein